MGHLAPFIDPHWPLLSPIFPRRIHATRDARGAARYNHVSAGVKDFKRNYIRISLPVSTDIDIELDEGC
jgi:hypothetical protein